MECAEEVLKISELSVKQMDTDSKDRLFTGWASVEVVDKDGEVIPIEEMKKHMNDLMDMGGFITDMHTNRVVGKILNWAEQTKKVGRKDVPGIIITGKIFDKYPTHDEVWNKIKSGEYKGLSFGGASHRKDIVRMHGASVPQLNDLENHEVAVVTEPANPEAVFETINSIAKSAKPDEEIVIIKIKAGPLNRVPAIVKGLDATELALSSDENKTKGGIMSEAEKCNTPEKPKDKEDEKKSAEVSKLDSIAKTLEVLTETIKGFDQRIVTLETKATATSQESGKTLAAANNTEVKLPKDEADEPVGSDKDKAKDSEAGSEVMEKRLQKMEQELVELRKKETKKVSTPRASAGSESVFDAATSGVTGLSVLKRAREGKPFTYRELAGIEKTNSQAAVDDIVRINKGMV
jgi:hypothetical protein